MTLAFVVVVVVVVDEPMTDEIDFSFLLTFFSFSLSLPLLRRNSTTHHRPANAGGQTTPGEKVIKQALLQRYKAWREVERGAVSLVAGELPVRFAHLLPLPPPPSTPPHNHSRSATPRRRPCAP